MAIPKQVLDRSPVFFQGLVGLIVQADLPRQGVREQACQEPREYHEYRIWRVLA